ncbi:MAG: radical SAM protein, partial [Ruminococcaceae bacterium]|nr:radical SAM protein [Oscillospiraceae bacterium]
MGLLPHREDGFCLGTRRQLAILSNGDVVPCCLDADGEIVFGNIFKSALSQILETKRYKTMYNSLSERKLTENLCRHCS